MTSRPVRLNKFLAERLGVSRREADELISAGKITINGRVAKLGDRVDTTSIGGQTETTLTKKSDIVAATVPKLAEQPIIAYNGRKLSLNVGHIYLKFNKPVGYVCSRRAQGPAPTLYELLPAEYRKLKTVGRLDKDSSGLILLTNDGDFAFQMTHPKFRKAKVYEVELDEPLAPLHQQMISDYGVLLEDGLSQFKIIKESPKGSYTVILTEGRNRQIRRTFASLGYKVTKLHRVQFGRYELGGLTEGKFEVVSDPV